MATNFSIQNKRGDNLHTSSPSIVLKSGEMAYDITNKFIYVGDGVKTILQMYNSKEYFRQLSDGSVDSTTIGNGEVKTVNINNGAVSTDKLADNSVTSAKIKDGEVKTNDLANGAVTNAKIADGAITSGKIGNGEVKDVNIETVSANKVTGTISTSQIANGAVTGEKIASGTITNDKIASVSVSKLTGGISINNLSKNDLLNAMYPVGSVYMSFNLSSSGKCPIASTLGGIWMRLKDKFLLGVGDSSSPFAEGGSSTRTLTISNMPPHNHAAGVDDATTVAQKTVRYNVGGQSKIGTHVYGVDYTLNQSASSEVDGTITSQGASTRQDIVKVCANHGVPTEGEGEPFDMMPPYIRVYMWRRES